jgi:uncharacterized protein
MLTDYIGIPQLRELAGRAEQYVDAMGSGEMPRLAGILHPDFRSTDGFVTVNVAVVTGAQGFPELRCHAQGLLKLTCQRCLGMMDWPLDLRFSLAVLDNEADAERFEDPFDTVLADVQGVRIADIVEDEILGSLPLAPRHDIDDCDAEVAAAVSVPGNVITASEAAEAMAEGDVQRPFADLAAMLGRKSRSGAVDADD